MPIAILPAAGRSRRMGRPKLLLPYGDSTILGTLVGTLREAAVEPIVLVVRDLSTDIARWGVSQGVVLATNPAPERGMLSSILEGLDACGGAETLASKLEASNDLLLVCPADLPLIRVETLRLLVASSTPAGATLVVPTYDGHRGHPLAIAAKHVRKIPSIDPAVGLRQLLEHYAGEVFEMAVDDPGILLDVDTPEAYRGLVGSNGE